MQKRLNVVLHPEIDALLEQLAPKLKLTSKTAVLQKAVQVLARIVDNDVPDKKFYVKNTDGSLQEIMII
jgi:hypothetical protein